MLMFDKLKNVKRLSGTWEIKCQTYRGNCDNLKKACMSSYNKIKDRYPKIIRKANHQSIQQQLWRSQVLRRTVWHLPLVCQNLYLCRCLWLVGLDADLSMREKHFVKKDFKAWLNGFHAFATKTNSLL